MTTTSLEDHDVDLEILHINARLASLQSRDFTFGDSVTSCDPGDPEATAKEQEVNGE